MKRSTPIHRVLLSLLLAVGSAPPICHGQYTFSTIDFPGAAETTVLGINNRGQIVGQYGNIDFAEPARSGNRGFVFDGETFQTISVPESRSTSAWGINDDGVIVGGYRTADGQAHGFRFDGSEYHDIVTPFADGATVGDINNRGHLVGTYSDDDFTLDKHGFFFDGAQFQSIDAANSNSTGLTGINDLGELVGYFKTPLTTVGFMMSDNHFTEISATSITQVMDINNEGQVVGSFLAGRALDDAWYWSFIVDPESIVDLDSLEEFADAIVELPGPDCTFSVLQPISQCLPMITGINSRGTIVGFYDNDDGVFHGFVGKLPTVLQAGDANQDLKFDQLDIVQVLIAGKYLTGQRSTWGEGDWDGAPGGLPGEPPSGDGVFDQLDIVAALATGNYLTGAYGAMRGLSGGGRGDVDLAGVPEPSAVMLAAMALLGLLTTGWRRGRRRPTRPAQLLPRNNPGVTCPSRMENKP